MSRGQAITTIHIRGAIIAPNNGGRSVHVLSPALFYCSCEYYLGCTTYLLSLALHAGKVLWV